PRRARRYPCGRWRRHEQTYPPPASAHTPACPARWRHGAGFASHDNPCRHTRYTLPAASTVFVHPVVGKTGVNRRYLVMRRHDQRTADFHVVDTAGKRGRIATVNGDQHLLDGHVGVLVALGNTPQRLLGTNLYRGI